MTTKTKTAKTSRKMEDGGAVSLEKQWCELKTEVADDKGNLKARFYSGARVRRYNWFTDESYMLEFSMDPQHVRLGRLKSGRMPVLDSHSSWKLDSVVGVVLGGDLEGIEIKLSQREELAGLRRDVADGIVSNISMGSAIHKLQKLEEKDAGNGLTVFRAVDWEPMEVSLVAVPADPDAHTLAEAIEQESGKNTCSMCTIELRDSGDSQMADQVVDSAAVAAAAKAEGERIERERAANVKKRCTAAKLSLEFADDLISRGVSLDDATSAIFAKLSEQSKATAAVDSVRVEVGLEQIDKVRMAASEGVLLRMGATPEKTTEAGRQFRHYSLLRIGEELLRARGETSIDNSPAHLAQRLMMSTSDFPKILVNAADKRLQAAYREVPRVWMDTISRQSNATDFKTRYRPRLSEHPSLDKLPEGGQITLGVFGEESESYAIATYAKAVIMTRQMIINDDLQAFNDIARAQGLAAARTQNDIIWTLWKANGLMGDGVALFHASHNNLGSGALGESSLADAWLSFANQKGIGGSPIQVNLDYLIVPPKLYITAQKLVSAVLAATTSNVNVFAGALKLIQAPHLGAAFGGSDVVWYAACTPGVGGAEVLEHAFLDGSGDGPMIDTEPQFLSDGFGVRAILDFGAAFMDWRGVFKSTGV